MAEEEKKENGQEASAEEATPKRKVSLLAVVGVAQILVLLGAGGLITKVMLFSKRPTLTNEQQTERAIASIQDVSSEIQNVELDEFTINLPGRKMMKAKLNIEVSNPATRVLIQARLPAIRAKILDVLTQQSPLRTTSLEGKLVMKDSIKEAINEEILSVSESMGIVREVYFLEFILVSV
jgi:flagellar basal body-associated protein FliL